MIHSSPSHQFNQHNPIEIKPLQHDSIPHNSNKPHVQHIRNLREQQNRFQINQLVRDWVINDLVPLETLQGSSFLVMMGSLDSRFQIPPTNSYHEIVLSVAHTSLRSTLEVELALSKCVCLHPELWTTATEQQCVSIYASYLTHEYKQSKILLSTCIITGTKEKLASALQDTVRDWKLDKKIVSMVSSSTGVSEALDSLELPLKKTIVIPCIALSINNSVSACIENNETVKSMRELCWEIMHYLQKDDEQSHLKSKFDCTESWTRSQSWVNMYDLFEWILGNIEVVNSFLTLKKSIETKFLKEEMLTVIRDISDGLRQLRLAVKMLIEQKKPQLSIVLPLLYRVYNSSEKQGTSNLTTNIKQSITRELKKLYNSNSIEEELTIATLLDPRFKSLQFLSDPSKAQDLVKRRILQKISGSKEADDSKDIQVVIKDEPDDNSCVEITIEPIDPIEPPTKRKKTEEVNSSTDLFFDLDDDQTQTPENNIEIELRRYLSEMKVPMNTDPCEWWKQNENNYQLLLPIAEHYLSIPATCQSPAQIYEASGQAFLRKRLALSAVNLDKQLFLYFNSIKNI